MLSGLFSFIRGLSAIKYIISQIKALYKSYQIKSLDREEKNLDDLLKESSNAKTNEDAKSIARKLTDL